MKTYTVKEIAELLGTNQETVRRWIIDNKLQSVKTSNKSGYITTESMLESFLSKYPKYIGAAAGTNPGLAAGALGVFAAGAAALGILKLDEKKNATYEPSEVQKILDEEIKKTQEVIKRKKEFIKDLEREIAQENDKMEQYLMLRKKIQMKGGKDNG